MIYDSPVTQTIQSFTFHDLQIRIAKCAGALASLGVMKGDRMIIYMPMIPEAASLSIFSDYDLSSPSM